MENAMDLTTIFPVHDCDVKGHAWVEHIQVIREQRWIVKRCEYCYLTQDMVALDE